MSGLRSPEEAEQGFRLKRELLAILLKKDGFAFENDPGWGRSQMIRLLSGTKSGEERQARCDPPLG